MNILPWIIVCAAMSLVAGAQTTANKTDNQNAQTPPARTLVGADEIFFGIPAFSFSGEPVCDTLGNLYFEVTDPQHMIIGAGPFLGVTADGSRHVIYTIPSEYSKAPGLTLQAVSPGGDYYLLNTDYTRYTLIAFNNNGEVASTRSLAIPPKTIPQFLAVADSGITYVQGYLQTSETVKKPRRTFIALFSASGNMLKDISLGAEPVDIVSLGQHPAEGAVVSGTDGKFYVLKADSIVILNQNGETERTFPFTKPDPKSTALRLDVSGGLMSVKFVSVSSVKGRAPTFTPRLLLLDAQTGEQRGDYVLDSSLSNMVLCFNRKDGYAVNVIKNDQAGKINVPLR